MEITSGADMELNWQWLLWQVAVPLGGPIALSCLIILLWQTGMPDFVPQWSIILDASPWTITFYTLALIGATLNDLWPHISAQKALGGWLIALASFAQIYTAFLVLWRHNTTFIPNHSVYVCAACMLVLAIALCHVAHSKSQGN